MTSCVEASAVAYYLLQQAIIRALGHDSILKKAIGRDWKGKLSPVLYLAEIVVAPRSPRIADAVFVATAGLVDSRPAHRKTSCHVTRPNIIATRQCQNREENEGTSISGKKESETSR